jgi:hypothetical protein
MLRALLAAAALATACNPYDPDLGSEPFRCGTSEPKCPDGYQCVTLSSANQICEPNDGSQPPDGGGDGDDGAALSCQPPLPDGELEPNENISDPTITPIPPNSTFDVLGAAICSDADIDMYRFVADVNGKNARVDVSYDATAGTLLLDMLNSSGVVIRSGAALPGDSNTLRADVNNLAQGNYFARVKAMPGVRNQYSIHFLVTADPLP